MRLILVFLFFSSTLFSQEATTDCLNHVTGTVSNSETGKIMPKATIFLKQNGQIIKEKTADQFGQFSFDLDCNSRYQISGQHENFTKNIKLVFTAKTPKEHKIQLELFPIKEFIQVKNEKRILVKSIEFIPDDFGITKEAASQLDIVYALMKKYPHMTIDIRFHSDARGDVKFLKTLTQKRADICANYLIKKGINAARINPIGYGATQLINRCKKNVDCSNLEHLENRRSEFVVVKNTSITSM